MNAGEAWQASSFREGRADRCSGTSTAKCVPLGVRCCPLSWIPEKL